jgi:histidyl-tRNA synthetase
VLAAILQQIGIPHEKVDPIYAVLDKKNKLPVEAFEEMLNDLLDDQGKAAKVRKFMELENITQVEEIFGEQEAVNELKTLMQWLDTMGVGDYCKFDPGIVRGLAYYTGIVFEVYDRASELRAICGGGRYDNLLRDFGGPSISATGMGMGDCVLEILLEEKGLLDEKLPKGRLDFFIVCAPNTEFSDTEVKSTPLQVAVGLAASLREKGLCVDLCYKLTGIGKQFKQASSRNADKCIIIGEEFKENKLAIKDMITGEQELVDIDEFLSHVGSN